ARMEDLIKRCRGSYDSLEFHKVYRAIYDFATADLSARYFDILKDRLYTAGTSSQARRSGQTALYKVHYALVRLMAPLLAFTADEVWSHTAKPAGSPASVHLALLPEPAEVASDLPVLRLTEWNRLMETRDVVLKALEEARQAKLIGTSLEARVRLQGYRGFETDLPSIFIVSQVIVEPGDQLRAIIEKADGVKCERCWKYSTAVGQDLDFPTVCDSCSATLRDMLG